MKGVNELTQLVFMENGRPVTDSLNVAEVFGKLHKDVMRDIRTLECSADFRERNFAPSTYTGEQGREHPKFIMTEQGFIILAMGYNGAKAMEFKEKYIAEFERMKSQKHPVALGELSPLLQLMIQTEQKQKELEQRQDNTDRQMEIVKETFLQRDDDWRNMITGLLKGAAFRRGKVYQDMWNLAYKQLEDRGRCLLDKRLSNLKERLKESGATKSKITSANRLDVIEEDHKLKEIFTTIVKELSIGTM